MSGKDASGVSEIHSPNDGVADPTLNTESFPVSHNTTDEVADPTVDDELFPFSHDIDDTDEVADPTINTEPLPVNGDNINNPTAKNIANNEAKQVVDSLYALEGTSINARKLKLAWSYWNELVKEEQGRLDNKKTEAKDLKTEVYQLIGFYSVFQGVLFQGVSVLQHVHGCDFSPLPISLSILTSVATILGVIYKFVDRKTVQKSVATHDAIVSVCFIPTLPNLVCELYVVNLLQETSMSDMWQGL